MENMKPCSRCKEKKSLTDFYSDKRAPDGLKSQCKSCHVDGCGDWAKRNKDARRKIEARSYAKHREKRMAMSKDWKDRNKVRCNEYHRQWKLDHPERIKELMAPARKRWKKNNPDAVAADSAKRRALKANAIGSHTKQEIADLFIKQNGICANNYCGKALTSRFHRDHIVALSVGGTNFIENIQLLCPRCNTVKGKKPMSWLLEKTKGDHLAVHV